ncbi:MAG: hypothetical protein K0M63_02595 [Weeksellaceae bacterium]|nr:hypothetical protein [Weeksellaceae bacterium]
MKTRLINLFFTIFIVSITSGQTLKFVSARTAEPLSNVSVFTETGTLLTTSDVEGNIQKEALLPLKDRYVLVYESYDIGNLTSQDVDSETVKLEDRISEIQTVVISSKKAKYMTVRGHFHVYLTVNREFNVYADGIATYVYDNDTKKLKNVMVEQYRTFAKSDEDADSKKVASLVYEGFLQVPGLDEIGRIKDHKSNGKKNGYKEIQGIEETRMQIHRAALQEKGYTIFGYSFYDFEYLNSVSFTKGSMDLKDFTEFDEKLNFKIKHKSEPEFHQMIKYSKFIPVEVSFSNAPATSKLKLNPKKSSYTYEYWKAKGFPNMQPVFESFFKDSLKEGANTAKP